MRDHREMAAAAIQGQPSQVLYDASALDRNRGGTIWNNLPNVSSSGNKKAMLGAFKQWKLFTVASGTNFMNVAEGSG